jgi:flagellar biosynthesis protein FlhF
MSANVRETEQQAIHRRFSVLNPTGLIFTKLDETVTYGGVLNVAVKSGLPLTMYTDGQRVPENLGWMSAKTLANWFKKDTAAAFADEE